MISAIQSYIYIHNVHHILVSMSLSMSFEQDTTWQRVESGWLWERWAHQTFLPTSPPQTAGHGTCNWYRKRVKTSLPGNRRFSHSTAAPPERQRDGGESSPETPPCLGVPSLKHTFIAWSRWRRHGGAHSKSPVRFSSSTRLARPLERKGECKQSIFGRM